MEDTAKSTEPEQTAEGTEAPQAETAGAETAEDTELDALDELDDVDFDLDEVENKIAPLALATTEPSRW
ncbi:ammosamide/lymphostin RiPP family protein [Kitasatospora sp. NPDC059812]|uniref:ammosamide/lymphostin RiPP family protein n=1 Tax=unclassified Kitasatospora TaxID=2633591 RepID=UPI0036473357